LAEAAARMLDGGINRLPVVEGHCLVGIVTRADLVRAFVRSDAELEQEIAEDVVRDTLWLDPNAVSIGVRGGRVTLTGTVETRTSAEILAKLVRRVPGVVSVVSDLKWEREP